MHAFSAFVNAGPLKAMPSTVSVPGEDSMVGRPSPPEPWIGSGKFGTPLARMHLDSAAGELAGPYLPAEAAALWLDPPHPETASARPAATTSRGAARMNRL